jgi:hypothetical protein
MNLTMDSIWHNLTVIVWTGFGILSTIAAVVWAIFEARQNSHHYNQQRKSILDERRITEISLRNRVNMQNFLQDIHRQRPTIAPQPAIRPIGPTRLRAAPAPARKPRKPKEKIEEKPVPPPPKPTGRNIIVFRDDI